MTERMKLYDIPRNSKIYLPISAEGTRETEMQINYEMCVFRTLDGAYSLITTPEGYAVHLSATAPVKKVGDHYELDET